MADRPVKVLMVEEDEDGFALVRDLLSETSAGRHEIHWAKDFDTAVDLMVNGGYDVCLVASRPGSLDALELLDEATARQCGLPVIFLAARGDYEVDLKAMKAGAAGYLLKSELSGPLLERSIRYAIARSKTDVADSKPAQTRICLDDARFEGLLQKVFDGISDPLIVLDRDRSVSMINTAARTYYGLESSLDVLGKPCREALCKDTRPCEECGDFLSVIDAPAATFERQRISDPGRREQVVIYSVYGKEGKRDASIARISDITERRTMERQLMQSEKLASLGLLVSGITHEINNPNTFISFNLPILRDYLHALMPIFDKYAGRNPDLRLFYMPYPRFRADLFKLLDNMEHGSSRIASIVSRLKSFLRKRDKSELQRTDIGKLVEQTVSIAQPELMKTVKSFQVIVPEDLPEITTDPEAIQQVVLNLLINAAHACDKVDSEVTLKVARESADGKSLSIEVRDNGAGMDETIKKKIFDPFFTTKGAASGTGLGLYICYNLLNNLGGGIEVDSTPGQGSTFRAILTDQGSAKTI
jgi:signal transduction histidine kinase/CheY-like chemotaxis protein